MKKNYVALLILILSVTYSFGQCSPDVTLPTITCPSNNTATCSMDLDVTPVVYDECGVVIQTWVLSGATIGSSPSTGINDASNEWFQVGTTTVTYYIEDATGNSATCNFNVTIDDYQAPLLICPVDLTIPNDPGACTAIVNDFGFMSAWDNCSGINVVLEPGGLPPGSAFPVGTTTNTYTFTDAAGNSSTCTFDVTVTDEEAPTISCPANITANTTSGQCNANVTIPPPTASDNCSIVSITNDFNSGGANASGTYPLGTTIVTYTATDSANKTITCSFEVNVNNSQNPVITLLGSNVITLEACDDYTELGATALDICLGDITGDILIDATTLDTSTVGSYTITYNVSNAAQVIRTINVVDTTSPSLTLIGPDPLTIGDCATYTELGAIANDPCFGDISGNIVIDNSSVNSGALGSYTVTYNVLDASGNPASQLTRTVTVVDVNLPVITLVGDNPQTIEACSTYNELGATAIDPCFGTDISGNILVDSTTVNTSIVGTYNVTYNVTDINGNIAIEVIRIVDVVDTTIPSITCPSNITVANDLGLCSAVVNYTTPVGTDDCLAATTVQTSGLASGSTFPLGTTTNTFIVTDAEGFTSTCSFDVLVNDSENPVAICKDISIQLDPVTGLITIVPSDIDNGSSDNCSVILNASQTDFDCTDIGNNTITLTVTDATGNTSTCDANITITDASENASVSIISSENSICQNASVIFTATPFDGGATPTYQWQINGLDVGGETASTFSTSSLVNSDQVTVLMTSSLSVCAQTVISNAIAIVVNDDNAPANAGADVSNSVCTVTSATLAGNAITGSGSSGLWTVTSGQISGFSFSDVTSPNSTFTGDIGETYTLTWSIDNPEPCLDTSDSMTINFVGCDALDFDGVDDNITFRDNYNFTSDFTIEVWIKPDVTNANTQTIISKREVNNLINGYDLRLVNNVISFNWNSGVSISASPHQITTNRWYHVAITYGSGTYILYINGVEVNNVTATAPIANTADCIVGAMDDMQTPFIPLNYFNGGMDELRIWDVALTATQIRKMMNQEIEPNSTNVIGSVVPIEVQGLMWSNLNGYYQMNQNSDLSAGNLISNNSSTVSGLLRYMTTLQPETAPLPYQSVNDGTWTNSNTWLYGSSQAIPNDMGIDGTTPITWNIVKSSHNISSGNTNVTLLGLIVDSNTLAIENSDPLDGQSLRITDYLKIDGTNTVLNLVGESQLIQDMGSIIDYSGTGKLHRDQQGTTNLFNYNYWGSPVSTNGSNFTIGSILRDGVQPVQWTTAHDADGSTNPVTISSRWLYLYENFPINSYADWQSIDQNSNVDVGLGFLMKGSGAVTSEQNYTFIGQPNNGTISTPITANYEALVGNPYPSAIDSHEFINDNSSSILGTIYFWEHYTTNNTHVTVDYQGGFAAYNLTGGTEALSPPEISGLGASSKIPERYIPVAQGFNVNGNATGGNVVFENDQRVFVKEAVTGNADSGSVFIRSNITKNKNTETDEDEAVIKRIRINFKTPDNSIRYLLLGFIPNNLATDGVDYGYDALNLDNLPNDMSWMIEDEQYLIQGVGDFDKTKQYPLGIFLSDSGNIEISLQELENFESEIDVFIYDALLGTYTKFNNTNYQMSLDTGDYLDRFFLTFIQQGALTVKDQELQQIVVNYLSNSNEIVVKTPQAIEVQKVRLINILGQKVKTWSITGAPAMEIRIPVKQVSSGNYIIKVETATGTFNKKVIIKY